MNNDNFEDLNEEEEDIFEEEVEESSFSAEDDLEDDFFSNNDKKEVIVESSNFDKLKQELENEDLDLIKEKYFSTENIIYESLKSRPLSFYKRRYQVNLNISFFLVALTFVLTTLGTGILYYKTQNHSIFLTNINGEIKEYERTDTRKKVVKEFIEKNSN